MTSFEEEINRSGFLVYKNTGDSMMPLLRENKDLVVITKPDRKSEKNDVVLFRRENGAYVLHRVFAVKKNGILVTGGDNRCFEEDIPEASVIGRLTQIIRDGRHITVNDDEYLSYLKKLPRRRFFMKLKSYPYTILKKFRSLTK